jgi:hypothetical protein
MHPETVSATWTIQTFTGMSGVPCIPRAPGHRLVFVNGMHLSWSSVVSAGLFIAMNPWSNTLFRAIGWRIGRLRPGNWPRPLTVIVAMFVVAAAVPLQAQYGRRPAARGNNRTAPAPDVLATAVAGFKGSLRAIDKKAIVIESADDQVVSFHRSKKTRFLADEKAVKPQDIPLGSLVTVNASKDSVGDLVAVDIIWKKP